MTEKSSEKKFRTAYGGKKRVSFSTGKETQTKQCFKDETDINNIMKKWAITGQSPLPGRGNPQYGDFSSIMDYQSSLNAVIEANAAFENLPAQIRKRFSNDPALFVDFVQNPQNKEELIELGLAERPPKYHPNSGDKNRASAGAVDGRTDTSLDVSVRTERKLEKDGEVNA